MSCTEINTDLPKISSQDKLMANEHLHDKNFFELPDTDAIGICINNKVDETTRLVSHNNEIKKEVEDKPRSIVNKSVTVEPALFLTLCAVAFQMITSTTLLIDKVCHVTYNYSDSICENFTHYPEASDKIQSRSADLEMYKSLIETVPAVLYTFFLGSWSDKHGRKFPIIFPIFGYICSTICNTFLVYNIDTPPEYLLISAVFIGMTGGMAATYLGTFSYIVDVTSEKNRTVRIAYAELALVTSIPIGIALSSVIYGQWSYMPVYVSSLALLLTSLMYTIFFVPETIEFENYGGKFSVFRDMFDLQNVKDNFKICTIKRSGNDRVYIYLLIFCMFILLFPQLGESYVSLLFVKTKFGWNQTTLGYYITYNSVMSVIGSGLLYHLVLKKYHLPDLVLGGMGVIGIIIKDVIISRSSAGWMLYMAASIAFFQFLSEPTVRSFLTKLVAKDECGKLFAVISSCESIAPILSSIAYTQLYKAFKDNYPGAVYVLSTGLAVVPFTIFLWILINKKCFTRRAKILNFRG